MKIEYICENDNIRLSEELKLHTTKKFYKNIKSMGISIFVNGKETKTFEFINKGDIITFDYQKEKEIEWPLYESKLDIAYEDINYIVVNKRKGLLSIPTKAEPKSLYQEVLYYLKEKGEALTISILNRLDKETSGLCVLAKNRIAANLLQPTHKKMKRKYLCLTHGIWDNKSGTIDTYINKDLESNKRYVSDIGQRAISNYIVKEEYDNISLVEFILDTGRTHQIRLHTSYMGHPILGDKMYGISDNIDLMMLHSYYVSFYHPFLNKEIEIYNYPKEYKNDK